MQVSTIPLSDLVVMTIEGQDTKTLKSLRILGKHFFCSLDDHRDIMSSSLSDIGYIQLIEMDIETDSNLLLVAISLIQSL